MLLKTAHRVPLREIATAYTEAQEIFEELSTAVRSAVNTDRDQALDMLSTRDGIEADADGGHNLQSSSDDFDDVDRPDSACDIVIFQNPSRTRGVYGPDWTSLNEESQLSWAEEQISTAVRSKFRIDRKHALDILSSGEGIKASENGSDAESSSDDFDDVYRSRGACKIKRFLRAERRRCVYGPGWTSLNDEDHLPWDSILMLIPEALSPTPHAPPPVPKKSSMRLRKYMEIKCQERGRQLPDIGQYLNSKELLKCLRICKTAYALVAESKTARQKLWLGPPSTPFATKPGTTQFCLNPLLAVTPYRPGIDVMPFKFTRFEYLRGIGKWRLTIWCSAEALLLGKLRSWGLMALACSSNGEYEVKVRLFVTGKVIGDPVQGVVACTNGTSVAELMHQVLNGNLERSSLPVGTRRGPARYASTRSAKLPSTCKVLATMALHENPRNQEALSQLPVWPLNMT